jgi:Mg2+ and Co2+ transporter CorA
MVGDRSPRVFVDRKTDLEQFRHEYFLLFLIPHFHRAALLMLQDRLVNAMNRLDISQRDSVREFRRVIRQTLGVFLRFTHRYWFHEVSDHTQAKELFRMISDHLRTAKLYDEVRTAIEDMSQYLDSDALRRQGETMVRLTVVATVGLIGVIVTGVFGMNLFALAERPLPEKIFYFLLVLIPSTALTVYTVLKSRRLADFLETLADDRESSWAKLAAFMNVWKRQRNQDQRRG